ncbi:MAG: AzlD domain-containing protein, partial [Helicobacter sp.]|nr:AzlD domain-containing protein [Helicobacter sp.]
MSDLGELDSSYILLAILAASFATALTRFLPYFVLQKIANNGIIKYLQSTMPLLIMTLLVFFSLQNVRWEESYGVYEMLGILTCICCFYFSKNAIFSMFSGIIVYFVILNI